MATSQGDLSLYTDNLVDIKRYPHQDPCFLMICPITDSGQSLNLNHSMYLLIYDCVPGCFSCREIVYSNKIQSLNPET